MAFKFQFGDMLVDTVTGHYGVLIGRADYSTGCNQYLVQPSMGKDGKIELARWIDEDRLILKSALPKNVKFPYKFKVTPTTARKPGGDLPAPMK